MLVGQCARCGAPASLGCTVCGRTFCRTCLDSEERTCSDCLETQKQVKNPVESRPPPSRRIHRGPLRPGRIQ
jgi:protein-arginine kinase activator protein McsA